MPESQGGHTFVLMNEEQKEQAARLMAMRQVVGSLIDCEERKNCGMKREDILGLFGSGGARAKKAIDDLVALKYVVCITENGVEETSGEVRIKTLTERYGTTFFGRKWLMDLEKS